jgi:hypothetical protein
MRAFLIAGAILAAATTAGPASAADLSGNYAAEGACPGPLNNSYRGTVTIRSSGVFHTLTWRVGNETILGTGIEHEGRMVIEFRFPNGQTGLMGMYRAGAGWRGNWAVHGAEILCSESWTPTR